MFLLLSAWTNFCTIGSVVGGLRCPTPMWPYRNKDLLGPEWGCETICCNICILYEISPSASGVCCRVMVISPQRARQNGRHFRRRPYQMRFLHAKCTIRWPLSVSLMVKFFFHSWEYLLLLSINHMSQPHTGEILELNLVWFLFYDSFS